MVGGGSNKSSGSSSSNQQSTSESQQYGSDVWGGQADYLRNLYAMGQQQAGQPMQGQQGLDQSNAYLNQAGNAYGQSNQNLQNIVSDQGIDNSVNQYARNMGQQYKENFMPQMQQGAIQAGGLGGSRQQIGNAMGAQSAMQAISDFTGNAYDQKNQLRMQAAGMIGNNAQGLTGLSSQGLANSDFARSMPWYNMQQYAGLLGGPTTLDKGGFSKSQSTGKTTGSNSSSGWNATVLGG